jgi:hypothetical protein
MREAIATGFFTFAALMAYAEALLLTRALRRLRGGSR